MGELVEDDRHGQAEDAVAERDDRIDPRKAEEEFGGRRIRSDRRTLDQRRLPQEEHGRPDHGDRDQDDREVAEPSPEHVPPRDAVDELPPADGLPHEERPGGRRRRRQAPTLEEPPTLEHVEQEAPEDDRGRRDQDGIEDGHARLRTNLGNISTYLAVTWRFQMSSGKSS